MGERRADQCHVSRKQKRQVKCLGVCFPLTPGCSLACIFCSAVPQKLNHSPLSPHLLRPSLGGASIIHDFKGLISRSRSPWRSPGEGQPGRGLLGAAPAPTHPPCPAPGALQGGLGDPPHSDSPEPSRAEPRCLPAPRRGCGLTYADERSDGGEGGAQVARHFSGA